MTRQAKHTPIPWYYNRDEGGNHGHNINVAEGEIAQVFDPSGNEDESVIAANARHIVHCVNCHDDLVEALELLLPRVYNDKIPDHVHARMNPDTFADVEKARAILAKATGKATAD